AASQGLDAIYRTGYAYAKAEILLMDLRQRGEFSGDLFAQEQPESSERVMEVLDQINARWGRGTLRPARVPVTPGWGMRRELLSPRYTTDWNGLWKVSCRGPGALRAAELLWEDTGGRLVIFIDTMPPLFSAHKLGFLLVYQWVAAHLCPP